MKYLMIHYFCTDEFLYLVCNSNSVTWTLDALAGMLINDII